MAKSKATAKSNRAPKPARGAKPGTDAKMLHSIHTPEQQPTVTRARQPEYLITYDKKTYCNSLICVRGEAEFGPYFPEKVAAKVIETVPTQQQIDGPPLNGSTHLTLQTPAANYSFDHTTTEVLCDCNDQGMTRYLLCWPYIAGEWRPAATVEFIAKCCGCTQCQTCNCPGTSNKAFPPKKKTAKKKMASKKKSR